MQTYVERPCGVLCTLCLNAGLGSGFLLLCKLTPPQFSITATWSKLESSLFITGLREHSSSLYIVCFSCFLCFCLADNHYQFRVLPFGIAIAQKVFTKVFVVVAAQLRHLGYSMFPYLDNWLLVASSHTEITSTIRAVCLLLTILGVCINEEKTVLVPTQAINFIGTCLDSMVAHAFLLMDCFAALTAVVVDSMPQPCTVVCHCLHLLGHMMACTKVMLHACLYMRCLQLWLLSVFGHHNTHHDRF